MTNENQITIEEFRGTREDVEDLYEHVKVPLVVGDAGYVYLGGAHGIAEWYPGDEPTDPPVFVPALHMEMQFPTLEEAEAALFAVLRSTHQI